MIRLLHVDDNQDDAELARLSLLRISRDLAIDWVDGAQAALTHVGEKPFDVVISDFQMPGMNGLDLLRSLREKGDTTPFIFLTGQGNEMIAAEALRAGADDYFTKEIGFAHYERLINSIHRIIENREERRKRREVEKRLYQLAETAGDIIMTVDLLGRILYVNQAFFERFGYAPEEVIGHRIQEFIPEEYHEEMNRRYGNRNQGDQGRYAYEVELLNKKGDRVPMEVRSSLFAENSAASEVLVIARDVSERREAQRQIWSSEERFRALFEVSPAPTCIIDARSCLVDGNEAFSKLLNMKSEEYLNKRVFDLGILNDEQVPIVRDVLDKNFQGMPQGPFEWRFKRRRGKQVVIEFSSVPIRTEKGLVVIGIAHDISARKEAERVLAESERRYRLLYESAGDAIFILDKAQFVECNPHTLQMFNCERDEIIGFTPADFSPSNQPNGATSQDLAEEYLNRVIEVGSMRFSWRHRTRDGVEFDAEVSLSRLASDDRHRVLAIVRRIRGEAEPHG